MAPRRLRIIRQRAKRYHSAHGQHRQTLARYTAERWARPGLLLVVLALGSPAVAQDLEPRLYSNAPVGMNFVIAGYGYSQGGVAFDPAVPLTDANIQTHSTVFAFARSLDIAGLSGKFDIVLPYAKLSGSALNAGTLVEREVTGLADPRMRLSVNLYGAPALSVQEFASYRQDLIVGASLQVTAPAGQYDSDKLVNIGTNRWSFKPELGISKAFGAWTLELAAAATYYTDNDDFFGGSTLAQDPIYSAQTHLTHNLGSRNWLAVDAVYYTGGRSSIDGVMGNDLKQNTRFGATYAHAIDRHHSIKLHASSGVFTRAGSDFDTIVIAWQYRWGAGY